MIRNKSFINFICAISIAVVLLVSITGRTVPVKAVGTTATIAGTAFVLTGAVYLSYVALTQGEMILPVAEELHNWLGSIGRKASQYSSGAAAYKEIYENLARDPAANVIDGIWKWTQERIKAFTNDFADTRIISNLVSYSALPDEYLPTTNYNYDFNFVVPQSILINSPYADTSLPSDYTEFTGQRFILDHSDNTAVVTHSNITTPVREVFDGAFYNHQQYINGQWVGLTSWNYSGYSPSTEWYIYPRFNQFWGYYQHGFTQNTYSGSRSIYPIFADAEIYDETTGEIIETRDIVPTQITPSWNDPDNNNRPIIPWVPIPQLPANINPPSGYNGISQWGFNLQDLLDTLEDLAGTLIDIGAIAGLINEFAGLHGDEYYIEYNDGDTNFYTYYQPTIFDNDTEYVTYNIDISEQDDIIPVDLNTIQLYTDNNYLDEIKKRSQKFGETLGEYFVFWHNSDPITVYVIFGSVIVIFIGAFIGKWGHS